MTVEISSKQLESLIEIVGEKLDSEKNPKTGDFLFRLYLRLILQAKEQGVLEWQKLEHQAAKSVEANEQG